ncbi:hypothetical protein GQ602_001057 [Ophiocordyceps camponoti-floridani]|uniref:Uncharacterized protein n=1 Tax=Ophiocordyceps camponoti-floridani TaxID=2030778 RepID=A0A8H4QDA2_9HYPO|nr:hypothetical protein GQ602_001057 [Ophiocordyceps camponoti-floridani]
MLLKQLVVASVLALGSVTANPIANPEGLEIDARNVEAVEMDPRSVKLDNDLVARAVEAEAKKKYNGGACPVKCTRRAHHKGCWRKSKIVHRWKRC